jgi:hypothetical protein
MVNNGTFPSTAAAEEDSGMLFIDKRHMRRLCLGNPQIALAALEILASRLRRAAGMIEALSLREVDQRTARLPLSKARLRGHITDKGIVFELLLANQQIAARIGTVGGRLSRAFPPPAKQTYPHKRPTDHHHERRRSLAVRRVTVEPSQRPDARGPRRAGDERDFSRSSRFRLPELRATGLLLF